MKTLALVVLLVLSLTANAFWYFTSHDNSGTTAVPAAVTNTGSAASNKASLNSGKNGGSDVVTPEEAARLSQLWSNLQGGDIKGMVARLRAAGFPPSVVRALVMAQVQQQFAARRAALLAQQPERQFWKTGQSYFSDPKVMSGLRDLGREQSAMLKELLGPDAALGYDEAHAYQQRQFGNLSRDKAEQAQSILSDYSDLRSQIYQAANGVMLPEDREKLALLEREQKADLAVLLTPEELENYELRSSQTANSMRSQLVLFNPTEDEFRAIFRLQQAFDEKYGSANSTTTLDLYRQRQSHQQELTDQINAILTPDRAQAYKQAIDPAYQMINRLVARLELPASAATSVVEVQQDINKRANLVRSDRSLTPDLKNAQLDLLSQEATTKLTTVLGTRGLDAYKQYGGGWVQNLVPRRPPPGGTQ